MLTTYALTLLALGAQATPAPAAQAPIAPASEAKPTPDGPVIALDTTAGTIQIALYATKSPLSTKNIMGYVRSGHYAGTVFHRVIPGFMVQGGGMDAKLVEKPTIAPVRNEARNGLLNTRGSVALARTSDPHSATSQFFVNVKDNPALDFGISRDGWGYTVFGEVISGMDIVDQIVSVPTTTQGVFQNVPITPVVIRKVTIVSEPAAPKATAPSAGSPSAAKPVTPPPSTVPKTGKPAAPAGPASKPKPRPTASPLID